MTIYLLLETTKYGIYTRTFKDKVSRGKAYNELIKAYSNRYNIAITNISQLSEVSGGEVFIDVFETELE